MIENDEKLFLGDVMTLRELQTYQDMFCEAQRIYLKCFDMSGIPLTKLSGRDEDKKILYKLFGKYEIKQKLQEVAVAAFDASVPIWKDTEYTNIKFVGVPNIVDNVHEGVWVGIVVYRKKEYADNPASGVNLYNDIGMYGTVTKNGANRAIKLLIMLSTKFISAAYDNSKTIRKFNEIKEKENKIKEELVRKESISKILQLFDNDEEFEKSVNRVIQEICKYLQICGGFVGKSYEEKKEFEIFATYSLAELEIQNESEMQREILSKLIDSDSKDSVIIVDPKTENDDFDDIVNKYNIKSFISVPIMIGKEPAIYAVFFEYRYDRIWDSNTVSYLFDVCKMIQNVLFKRITKNSLISSYAALKEILNNLGSGILVADKETKTILFCNDIINEMAGKDMMGQKCYDLIYGGFNETCKYCLPMKQKNYYISKYDEKSEKWYDLYYNDITWVDGKKVTLCNITDVTDKKKYQQKIEFQANNDFLTGLFNRMRCEEDLSGCIKDAIRAREKGSLLFIDLDDFKHINDGLGHQYGDMLLKMISVGLQQIPGIEKRCYRVGGDEFIIIIEPYQYHKKDMIIDEIQKLFSRPWMLGDAEYYCTMSMGVVDFVENGTDVNDLIKKADIAMYDAKKSGKNRWVAYSKGEDEDFFKRLDMEKNMRSAVAVGCNEFEVYIQPIMIAENEICIGGEALVRWNSSELGFMTPGDFIPLAEHLGLITPIGYYVLRQACITNKKWSDMGINLRINVNLSIIQLLANNVVDTIREIIEKTGVNPQNLVLEVTESLAINDMTRMKRIIKEIKELGVRIALDDFGTGYSSLNYIKQMDLDVIKVDRTFIKDISKDDYAKAFVKLIAELSEKLEVQVCVEGVEEKEQLEILKKLNISMMQGYYFGKPMKIKEFEKQFLKIYS